MQEKINYVSPECEILEIQCEGVMAGSGPQFNDPFNNEQDW